jgi:hypothetical protein
MPTTVGKTLGIPAVNGDGTHNFFSEPGTPTSAAAFEVVERYTGTDRTTNTRVSGVPATMAVQAAQIVDEKIVKAAPG